MARFDKPDFIYLDAQQWFLVVLGLPLRIGSQYIVMAITDDRYLLGGLQHYPRKRSLFNVALFHAVWEERFDKLSAQNSFAIPAGDAQTSALQTRTQERSQYSSWKLLFRPHSLGIIGLALAVVLSVSGYKLSHYDHYAASSSRIPVVKLWLDPQKDSVAALSRLKTTSHLVPGSLTFPIHFKWLPRLSRAVVCIHAVRPRSFADFNFLIPFRSPPLHRSSRA